jgi:Phage integrase, N-terminal SAM-like domain
LADAHAFSAMLFAVGASLNHSSSFVSGCFSTSFIPSQSTGKLLQVPTMAKDNDPKQLSPIAQRMQEDLQLNGKGERTQESYILMLRKFTEFLKREPDSATEDDLRNYLLFIKNQRQWSNSTINVAYCSLKFFFSKTCPQVWPTLKKLKVQPELKLPTVLTVD